MDEERLALCFKVMRGGKPFLGVKSPWWAHLCEDEYMNEENARNKWTATREQITYAEAFFNGVWLELTVDERKLLICRCGTGYLRSFRKCSKKFGMSHEKFRLEFQRLMEKVKILVDEKLENQV